MIHVTIESFIISLHLVGFNRILVECGMHNTRIGLEAFDIALSNQYRNQNNKVGGGYVNKRISATILQTTLGVVDDVCSVFKLLKVGVSLNFKFNDAE